MHAAPPEHSEGGALAPFIRKLSDADTATREAAAKEIFRRGCKVARTVTTTWFIDSALAKCFLLDEIGAPKMTVGVAVNPRSFDHILSANGTPRLANVPDDQDAKEFELDFPDRVKLDILTTSRPNSGGAIDRFLHKFGEGIQQVELEVNNVDRATEILSARFGVTPVYPQTRAGADGTRVNFYLVPGEDGKKVLIELVEIAAATRP